MTTLRQVLIDEVQISAVVAGGTAVLCTALWVVDRVVTRRVGYQPRHDREPAVFPTSAYNLRAIRDAREARTTQEIRTAAARTEQERKAAYEQWFRSVYRALPAGTALDRPIEAVIADVPTGQYPLVTPAASNPALAELVAA